MLRAELPPLPLDEWVQTKDTLHLWSQVVGKVRLATAAPRNHWWHAPLYLNARGLTTRRLHRDGITFEIAFDLAADALVVRTRRGAEASFPLEDGLSVAEFDRRLRRILRDFGVDVAIVETPYGVPMTTPFPEDIEHCRYQREYVQRWWDVLNWSDAVLEEFAGWFTGKTSPVHLFWHSFDLAVTRFSGRRAPGPAPTDPVAAEAYSHEVVSFGFWAGDANVPFPAYYAYTAPEPAGLTETPLLPAAAAWQTGPTGSLALLPYEDVRTAEDPRATLLAFLDSAYRAGATRAGWDVGDLESRYAHAERH